MAHIPSGTTADMDLVTFREALDAAFAAWCAQTGRDPEKCDFHDPSQSLWFPTVEET